MSEYAAIIGMFAGLGAGIVLGFLWGLLWPSLREPSRHPGSNPMWRGAKPPPPPNAPSLRGHGKRTQNYPPSDIA
jgi:hypothetical protein